MCGAARGDSAWFAQAQRIARETAEREAAEARELSELEQVIADGQAEVARVVAVVKDRHPAFSR